MATFEFPGPPTIEAGADTEGIVRWARLMTQWAQRIMSGKTANFGEVTLTENVASSTLTDARLTTGSVILFDPLTANAATELYGATMYVTSANRMNGSFTITHANNAQTDRTFRYTIMG